MALIYVDPTKAQPGDNMDEYMEFTKEIVANGVFNAGDPLAAPADARTVRVHNGSLQTFDGPFAETKEYLAGYYILNCDSIDQAVATAAKIPDARTGSVEVRPIIDM